MDNIMHAPWEGNAADVHTSAMTSLFCSVELVSEWLLRERWIAGRNCSSAASRGCGSPMPHLSLSCFGNTVCRRRTRGLCMPWTRTTSTTTASVSQSVSQSINQSINHSVSQ